MAFGLVILVAMAVIAIFAPLISGEAVRTSPFDQFIGPSGKFWFGTDSLGRDVYARTIQGSRVSLFVGFTVAVVTTVLGLALGLVAGYFRKIDNVVMRVVDGLMAIPAILLALALISLLGPSLSNVIVAICVLDTPRMVRIVRGSVLSLREQMYVEAARTIGASVPRILILHIAPNTFAPVIVQATYTFAQAILVEAALSFLGAGVPPTNPSWGNIMADGRTYIQVAPWIIFFPGLFLSLMVLSINLVGDGLRDTLDPRLKRRV
jgi:peptide/nickel transport system permease protein